MSIRMVMKMIRNGWYCCPYCGQKLFKVTDDFIIKGAETKCKRCKKIINMNYEPMSLSDNK